MHLQPDGGGSNNNNGGGGDGKKNNKPPGGGGPPAPGSAWQPFTVPQAMSIGEAALSLSQAWMNAHANENRRTCNSARRRTAEQTATTQRRSKCYNLGLPRPELTRAATAEPAPAYARRRRMSENGQNPLACSLYS